MLFEGWFLRNADRVRTAYILGKKYGRQKKQRSSENRFGFSDDLCCGLEQVFLQCRRFCLYGNGGMGNPYHINTLGMGVTS